MAKIYIVDSKYQADEKVYFELCRAKMKQQIDLKCFQNQEADL